MLACDRWIRVVHRQQKGDINAEKEDIQRHGNCTADRPARLFTAVLPSISARGTGQIGKKGQPGTGKEGEKRRMFLALFPCFLSMCYGQKRKVRGRTSGQQTGNSGQQNGQTGNNASIHEKASDQIMITMKASGLRRPSASGRASMRFLLRVDEFFARVHLLCAQKFHEFIKYFFQRD